MSENSFEAFDNNSGFENPFPGAIDGSPNPFEPADGDSPKVVEETEKKKRGRKKKEVAEGEETGPKREMAPRLNSEQKTFVVKNYATLGSEKVAEELGVNINQVRNTISQFRKDMQKRIDGTEIEEEKAKYSKFIEVFLPKRVSGEGAGDKKRERKVGNQSIIDELLKDLLI